MQYFLIVFEILIFLSLITIIIVFAYKRISTINKFNTNGIIIFKIDPKEETVMRVSNRNVGGTLNFESKHEGIHENETVSLENFLVYFDKELQDKCKRFLSKNNFKNTLRFNTTLNRNSFEDSNYFEVFKKLKITKSDTVLNVTFYPSETEKKYYCSIQ
ncbi:UNVERIFIED_CONTAM: hypothetical protein O8I53_11135 [Campylobacter lari]